MHFETIVIENEQQLQRALTIRKKVFVEEQHVPLEDEVDELDVLDGPCRHLLITTNEDEAVGTGRVRLIEQYGKLQRVAVLKDMRQFGIGRLIIAELETLAKQLGAQKTKLDAQVHAIGFYEKLGYTVQSDVFLDAGIEHVLMTKSL
ncbi:GNAT family N-acetyltransferase [Kurthia senegalensis]|uniref:GNAT family N-acetyltransferase n=1 Tax=Kurthia senegalensis TaxID=1033740 RepID=UPI000288E6CE|nr:GNAT family N-acetyltransferase [Kurthia senegalensis]